MPTSTKNLKTGILFMKFSNSNCLNNLNDQKVKTFIEDM